MTLGDNALLTHIKETNESWFLARVFRLGAHEGIRRVVSFSDPVARRDAAGHLTFPGHVGVIYQALAARYAGRSTPRTLFLLPDGRVLNERAFAKLRALDAGHGYVEELLRSFGAPPRYGADPTTWVPTALCAAGVRTLRHPGNHRYLFRLGDRRVKRSIRMGLPSLPYPKRVDRSVALPAGWHA
jgi:hypothetical protein